MKQPRVNPTRSQRVIKVLLLHFKGHETPRTKKKSPFKSDNNQLGESNKKKQIQPRALYKNFGSETKHCHHLQTQTSFQLKTKIILFV